MEYQVSDVLETEANTVNPPSDRIWTFLVVKGRNYANNTKITCGACIPCSTSAYIGSGLFSY